MAVGCTGQVAVPQIEWVAMEEQWPPIGVEVLACGVGKEFGGIHTNQLDKGSDIGSGYDPELYYWAGGEDFDEVTHWAPMPAMPPASKEAPTVSLAPETEYLLSGRCDHQEWVKLKAFCATPPAAEQPDTVAVPRELLRVLTDTAITEWHDPGENEAAQDRNECLCCGVEGGHNADCSVAIALRLLAGGA